MKTALQLIMVIACGSLLFCGYDAAGDIGEPLPSFLDEAVTATVAFVTIMICAVQLYDVSEYANAVRMRQVIRHFDDWFVVCRADDFVVTEMSLTLVEILERRERDCIGKDFNTLLIPEAFQGRHREIMQAFVNSVETRKITNIKFKGIEKSLLIQKVDCADGLYLLASARTV